MAHEFRASYCEKDVAPAERGHETVITRKFSGETEELGEALVGRRFNPMHFRSS